MSSTTHRATLWIALALLVAATVCLLATPGVAHGAGFMPSQYDSFAFDRLYIAGATAYPEAVSVDATGSIYYTWSDYNSTDPARRDRIYKIKSDGSAVWNAGSPYTVPGTTPTNAQLWWPCGLAVDAQNRTWVADTYLNRIKRLTTTGTTGLVVGGYQPGSGQQEFNQPKGIAVDASGTVYVADTGNNRIQVLSANGAYLRSWGATGTGQGQFNGPDGVCVAPDGNIWVADTGNNRVQEFTPTGSFVSSIGRTDCASGDLDGEFYGPMDVAVDPWGVIYVADSYNARIQRFAPDGTYWGQWGSLTSGTGDFIPTDIATDAFGNLLVTDPYNDRVQKWRFQMANPDTNPPVTSSNVATAWVQGTTYDVHLTSVDASLSVAFTYYSTDGTTPTVEYTAPFTVSTEGTTPVKYYAVDIAQNAETVKTDYLRLDGTPPVTSCDTSGVIEGTSAIVHLNATDSYSGVDATWYNLNGGFTQQYSGAVYLPAPGLYTIGYYSFDAVGNVETWNYTQVQLLAPDNEAPVTSSNIPGGWQNADVSVRLTATDASGISATYYSVNGSYPTVPYTSQFLVSTEGTTTVKYYSVDTRSNVETVHAQQVQLDKTDPIATSNVQSSYITTATIGLQATDALSGVLDIAWRLDGGPWQHGASIVATGFGTHNFDFYATDVANNQQPIQHGGFTILQPDSDPPVTGDNIGSGWVQGPYSVVLNSYDQISQVQGIYWSTDGTTPTVMAAGSTATFTVSAEGPQTIKYYAIDTRGNKEALHTKTLYVDSTPPSTTSDAQASYPATATIRFTASDARSGIAYTKYRLDAGSWQTGSQVVVGAPGQHTLDFYSVDGAGNSESTKTATFRISLDTTPPVTTDNAPAGWVTGPVNVTLSATDASSAVTATYFSLDGTIPTVRYYTPVYIEAEGETTLKYYSVDAPGNAEIVHTRLVKIDNSAPVTLSDAHDTYVDQAVLSLTPSDPYSGVSWTKYRIDGGEWQTGTQVTVLGYYTHSVEFYSQDACGNTEAPKTVWFRIQARDQVFEQTDADICYKGAWDKYAFGGYGARSTDPTAVVHFATQGTRVVLYGYTGPDMGIGRLVLDDGSAVLIDFYSSAVTGRVWSFDSGTLPYSNHTARLEYAGLKNAASTGYAIGFDAIRVEGDLLQVPDTAAPVTTATYPANWVRDSATVSLSAYDATSGVAATYYSKTGGTPTTVYSGPFSITSEGQSTIKYYSVDARGNAETIKQFNVRVDNTPPVTTDNAASSYVATATINLSASDPLSGVSSTKWRLDGGAWQTSAIATVPYSAVTSHTVEYYSTDVAGNTESTHAISLVMFRRAEQTDPAAIFDGSWYVGTSGGYSGGSYTYNTGSGQFFAGFSGTAVRWVGTKGPIFGIATVSVDGGPPEPIDLYAASNVHQQVLWSASGLSAGFHTLRIVATGTKNGAATNKYVNVDAIDVYGSLVADAIPPATTCSASGSWRRTAETVSLSAEDTFSWVATTRYTLDGSSATTYSAPFIVSGDGVHSISYWSVDAASNTETTKTATVRIDGSAPLTTDDAPVDWVREPYSLHLVPTDAVSGVAATTYTVNGGPATLFTGAPILISSEGTTTVAYSSTDVAGNVEPTRTATVRVDSGSPSTTDDAPAGWSTKPVTLHLASTDPVSGPSGITYRLDGDGAVAYAGPISVTKEGTSTLAYSGVDRAGNHEDTHTVLVRIDTASPSTSSDATTTYLDSATVHLSPSDATSGIQSTSWRLDSGPWMTGTLVSTTTPGVHLLEWFSTDVAGNAESPRSATFSVKKPYEQDDSRVYYKGTWQTGTSTNYSGGSYKYLASAGYATFSFAGTGFDLITTKGTIFGIASISVDGSVTATADLYSPSTSYRQKVASVSGLSSGSHVARIDWTGTKNASATAAYLNVDALQIEGLIGSDTTVPSTTSNADANWHTSNVTVALAATDAFPGVAGTYYRLNGGAVTTYTAPFVVSNEAANALTYWSTDLAGNTEPTRTASVKVDKTPAVTTSDADAAWHSGPTYLNLAAVDAASGVASIDYRLGVGTLDQHYTGHILVTGEGTNTYYFRAVDIAGNVETTRSATVKVDSGAPGVTSTLDTAWHKSDVTVSMSASDSVSGVKAIMYSLNSGQETTYTAPFSVTATGTTSVAFRAIDNAGNSSQVQSGAVKIDKTAPVVNAAYGSTYYGVPATVTVNASDAVSGIQAVKLRVDSGSWQDATSTVVTAPGPHSVDYYAIDQAGNSAAVQNAAFTIYQHYEQTDSNLYYQGAWTTGTATAYSGGSYKYLASPGAVVIAANGSALDWYTSKASIFGIAKISVDGTATTYVDLYSSSVKHRQKVWSVAGLSNGLHVVRIEYTGSKNASATSAYIGVDALEVGGTLGPNRYEQDNAKFYYDGSWTTGLSSSYSGGSYKYLASQGSVNIAFTGTQMDWITSKAAIFGIARVSVDGGSFSQVNLYAASAQHRQKVWSVSGLPNTTHIVRIEWTGTKDPSATNNYIGLDAADLVGTPTDSRYEQTQPQDYYEGAWVSANSSSFSGGSYKYLPSAGAANIPFVGTSFSWIGTKGPSFGIARVTIDDSQTALVDLYSASNQHQQALWTVTGLPNTYHHVRIEWTGTKNPSASSNYVNFDAADLFGAPSTFYYEQDNALPYYTGAWTTGNSVTFSGGSYKYLPSAGSATFGFNGTSFDWIASKGATFGIARVSVDGTTVADVDLYAPSTSYKEKVWSVSGLSAGSHVVTVSWTGTKNPSASNNYINVDACNLYGVLRPYDPLPQPTRFQENAPQISYSGLWSTGTSSSYSGGTYTCAESTATATVPFTGTSVSWIATTGSIFGIASVRLDGGPAIDVDLYSATTKHKTSVWSASGLTDGSHTLTISWTGRRNPASTRTIVDLDAVDILGSLR